MICTGLLILFVIVFIRRRKEPFLILTPALFILSGIFGALYGILRLYPPLDLDDHWYLLFFCADYLFYHLGHWVFTIQYLRTSLILPKLFIEAKFEWVL